MNASSFEKSTQQQQQQQQAGGENVLDESVRMIEERDESVIVSQPSEAIVDSRERQRQQVESENKAEVQNAGEIMGGEDHVVVDGVFPPPPEDELGDFVYNWYHEEGKIGDGKSKGGENMENEIWESALKSVENQRVEEEGREEENQRVEEEETEEDDDEKDEEDDDDEEESEDDKENEKREEENQRVEEEEEEAEDDEEEDDEEDEEDDDDDEESEDDEGFVDDQVAEEEEPNNRIQRFVVEVVWPNDVDDDRFQDEFREIMANARFSAEFRERVDDLRQLIQEENLRAAREDPREVEENRRAAAEFRRILTEIVGGSRRNEGLEEQGEDEVEEVVNEGLERESRSRKRRATSPISDKSHKRSKSV